MRHLLNPETYDNIINREQTTARFPFRVIPTRAELDTIALVIAARYQVAVKKGVEVRARELGRQLQMLARYADEVTL
jgi:hypothetical protein